LEGRKEEERQERNDRKYRPKISDTEGVVGCVGWKDGKRKRDRKEMTM
jgi:hypothetical protein